MIVKSDGHGAYISGDAAYYLDKRERGFDRCLILLGADHHGYVGRMMALCAAFGDEPGRQPRDPHRPDGQPAQRRRSRCGWASAPAPSSRCDDLVDAIGVDAARYALARYPSDTNHRHRPRPVGEGRPATTRSSTCSTPTPGVASILRNAADLGCSSPDVAPRRCSPTRRRASCCARSPSSRASSRPRPSCASRTGWRATSRTPPRRTTGSTTPAGCCRWATRSRTDLHRARLLLVEATRDRARQRPRPARRLRARADVSRAHPRGRLGARRRRPARARLAARARRRQRPGPAAVVVDRAQGRRRPRGRRGAAARAGRRASARRRTSSTRPTSGPARAPSATRSPATTSTTPARRSCARRSRAGSPRRGSASTSAPTAS